MRKNIFDLVGEMNSEFKVEDRLDALSYLVFKENYTDSQSLVSLEITLCEELNIL